MIIKMKIFTRYYKIMICWALLMLSIYLSVQSWYLASLLLVVPSFLGLIIFMYENSVIIYERDIVNSIKEIAIENNEVNSLDKASRKYFINAVYSKKQVLNKFRGFIDASNIVKKYSDDIYFVKMNETRNYRMSAKLEVYKNVYLKKSMVILNLTQSTFDSGPLVLNKGIRDTHILLLQPFISQNLFKQSLYNDNHGNTYHFIEWNMIQKKYEEPIIIVKRDELCILKGYIQSLYKYDTRYTNQINHLDNNLRIKLQCINQFIESFEDKKVRRRQKTLEN